MRIALVITGGTLDSVSTESGLAVSPYFSPEQYMPLLDRLAGEDSNNTIDVIQPPFRIDSSQLCPEDIGTLVHQIEQLIVAGYEGILLGHGTDTLSYIAPALGAFFSGENWPCIALVSGMRPWYEEGSDGMRNLLDAYTIIRSGHYRGTMVVSSGRVLSPFNLRKVSHEAIDPFRTVRLTERSELVELSQVLQYRLVRGDSVHRPLRRGQIISFPSPFPSFSLSTQLRPVVAQQLLYPGLRAEAIMRLACSDIEHVILHAYAGGTACVSVAGYGIHEAVSTLRDEGVSIYLVSQQIGAISPGDYAVCQVLEAAGCLYIRKYTAETLWALLTVLSSSLAPSHTAFASLSQI
jgi:L-asparaginase/Glu-tRNA(Gln) amidotransferase subunit D